LEQIALTIIVNFWELGCLLHIWPDDIMLTGSPLRQQRRCLKLNTRSLWSSSPVDLRRHHLLPLRTLACLMFCLYNTVASVHSLCGDTTKHVSIILCVTRMRWVPRHYLCGTKSWVYGVYCIVLCAMLRQSCLCHCLSLLYPRIHCSLFSSSIECAHH